jgi:sugar (pentulose or hexulose) kinase
LEIPEEYLSIPQKPGASIGVVSAAGSRHFGLNAGTPVFAGSLDHHVAALGAGAGTIAPMCESTGTVLACLAETERYEPKENRCLLPGIGGNKYFKIAFTENSAGVLLWYQRTHAPGTSLEKLIREAERISPGCAGLTAKPRADTFPGLSGFTAPTGPVVREEGGKSWSHGHYVRAVMESVARSLRRLAEELIFQSECEAPNTGAVDTPSHIPPIVATGGGAKSDLWLQMKADLLGTSLIRTLVEEPACFGAAVLAAAGSGWFSSGQDTVRSWVRIDREFEPKG